MQALKDLDDGYFSRMIRFLKVPFRKPALRSLRLCNKRFYRVVNEAVSKVSLEARNYKPQWILLNFNNFGNIQKLVITEQPVQMQWNMQQCLQLLQLQSLVLICENDANKFEWIIACFSNHQITNLKELSFMGVLRPPSILILNDIYRIFQHNSIQLFETDKYTFKGESVKSFISTQVLLIIFDKNQGSFIPTTDAVRQTLKSLQLSGNFNASVPFLKSLNLESLSIQDSLQFTSVELQQLLQVINKLKGLKISNCRLITQSFFSLFEPQNLTCLELSGSGGNISLNWKNFKYLQHLGLSSCFRQSFGQLIAEQNFGEVIDNLRYLSLDCASSSHCYCNTRLCASIFENCKLQQLSHLSIERVQDLREHDLRKIGQLPKLMSLSILWQQEMDVLFDGLLSRKQLTSLSLVGDNGIISSSVSSQLYSLTNLTRLEELTSLEVLRLGLPSQCRLCLDWSEFTRRLPYLRIFCCDDCIGVA